MTRTYAVEGVVLKRINFGEADRIVTIYSKEKGKLVCMAKGVRKMHSKKRSGLEPATRAKFFLSTGKGMDYLNQVDIISSHAKQRDSLTRLTQHYQILEIIDNLTVDSQENEQVYVALCQTLNSLDEVGNKKSVMLSQVRNILQAMGFTYDKKFTELGLKEYIEELAERKLRSKIFLTVN